MQIVIYKEKDVLGKLSTRDLYEENFDIGDVEFVNYYYDEIIKRNVVVAMIDDESKVISMVHLNPYLYNISGKERWVHYLVAIATRKDYRKKGYMSRVLDEALKYLQNLQRKLLLMELTLIMSSDIIILISYFISFYKIKKIV